jgi:Tfp pilus assembly protein PilF
MAADPKGTTAHNNTTAPAQHVSQLNHFHQNTGAQLSVAIKYHQSGDLKRAEALYRQVLRLEPNNTDALHFLGVIAYQVGKSDAAVKLIDMAIKKNPSVPTYYNNLGIAYQAQQDYGKATECYERALSLNPSFHEAFNNLGKAYKDQGIVDDALRCFQEALHLKPDFVEASNNLGMLHQSQGYLEEAMQYYELSLNCRPDDAEAHLCRAQVLLLQGNYQDGWQEYEWRSRGDHVEQRSGKRLFSQPRWEGTPLAGRTILVDCEQGLGDTIQFIRYIPLVKARGGRVIFRCQKELSILLDGFPGDDVLVVKSQESIPRIPFDTYIPLLSLPGIFSPSLDRIVAEMPYIMADATKAEQWRRKLQGEKFNIGLVWSGNPKYIHDQKRSCALDVFAELSHITGAVFFSLQKGVAQKQATHPPKGIKMVDVGEKLQDFSDTAAATANLDLVISVDTAVAHLAGAMAKKVWVLLPFDPDWRWLLMRETSPWYPTMRLFRQPKTGDWETVLQRVANELEELIRQKNTTKKLPRIEIL